MGQTPDELKAQVERTRAALPSNVDTLADRVVPSRIAHRRTESLRRSASGLKDRVMGTASDALQSTRESASSASSRVTSTVSDATSSLSDAAQRAPDQIRTRTQGSPLAAGLIAFGAGALAAALIPSSEAEGRAANRLRENADKLEPAKQALTESAQQMKDNLVPAAQEGAQHVKDAAASAASATADQAKQAGSDVADQTKNAAVDLREHTAQGAGQVREQAQQ